MPCNNCGGAVEMQAQTGGVTEGHFKEKYKCVNCGAVGSIRGKAENSPQSWKRTGGVFD